MDGRAGHFQRRSTRKPALQLRPQPRFIQPPQTPAPGNAIRVFNRPGGGLGPRIPGPIPAGNGAADATAAANQALAANDSRPQHRGWVDADAWGDNKLVVYGGLSGDDAAPLRLADTWILVREQAHGCNL